MRISVKCGLRSNMKLTVKFSMAFRVRLSLLWSEVLHAPVHADVQERKGLGLRAHIEERVPDVVRSLPTSLLFFSAARVARGSARGRRNVQLEDPVDCLADNHVGRLGRRRREPGPVVLGSVRLPVRLAGLRLPGSQRRRSSSMHRRTECKAVLPV